MTDEPKVADLNFVMKARREKLAALEALGITPFAYGFDPTHDTPAALRQYGGRFMSDPRFEWQFLTARSVPELLPVLDGFGQDVRVEKDASGRPTRTMNHMLKMFLIDPDGVVREIYSLAYLQQPVMFNDIKTLALEADSALAKAR